MGPLVRLRCIVIDSPFILHYDLKWLRVRFAINSGKIIFMIAAQQSLRALLSCFFHGEGRYG